MEIENYPFTKSLFIVFNNETHNKIRLRSWEKYIVIGSYIIYIKK